jgi:DNA-binding transcriptional regulator YiaG
MVTGVNLTTHELALRLHVKTNTLANWRIQGTGPKFIKFGRTVLYPVAEVEKWEQEHLHTAVSVRQRE